MINNTNVNLTAQYKVQPKVAPAEQRPAAEAQAPQPCPPAAPPAPQPDPVGDFFRGMWGGICTAAAGAAAAVKNFFTATPPAFPTCPPGDAPAPEPAPTPAEPKKVRKLNPQAVDTTSQAKVDNFLWNAFKQSMGRPPHGSELAAYRGQIMQKGQTPLAALEQIRNQPEARINAAGKAALGRDLTAAELAMYNAQRADGISVDKILKDIQALASAAAGFPATSNEENVARFNGAAQATLGRNLTDEEQVILQAELANENRSVDEIVKQIGTLKDELGNLDRDAVADPCLPEDGTSGVDLVDEPIIFHTTVF